MQEERSTGAIAVLGGVLVMTGALLPWFTTLGGARTYLGVTGLNGRLLFVGGALCSMLGIGYVRRGKGSEVGMGFLGFILLGFSTSLVIQLLTDYRSFVADPVLRGRLGPGLFVSTTGAAIIFAGVLAQRSATSPGTLAPAPGDLGLNHVLRAALVLLSACAGVIHFVVIGPHFLEQALFGAFFAVVAPLQIGLSMMVALRPSRNLYVWGSAGNAALAAIWLLSRTTGLPFGPEAGIAEPVGFADALATAYEAGFAILAATLLGTEGSRRPLRRWAMAGSMAALAAAVIAPTAVSLVESFGASGFSSH